MRLAAAQSLAQLRSSSAQDQARILQIQLELVQDDDEEIRQTARQSIGSDRHLAIIAETIVRELAHSVEPAELVQRLVLKGCGTWLLKVPTDSRAQPTRSRRCDRPLLSSSPKNRPTYVPSLAAE